MYLLKMAGTPSDCSAREPADPGACERSGARHLSDSARPRGGGGNRQAGRASSPAELRGRVPGAVASIAVVRTTRHPQNLVGTASLSQAPSPTPLSPRTAGTGTVMAVEGGKEGDGGVASAQQEQPYNRTDTTTQVYSRLSPLIVHGAYSRVIMERTAAPGPNGMQVYSEIPPEDSKFSCTFTHAVSSCNGGYAIRNQINALTPFIDASMGYTSEVNWAKQLRNLTNYLACWP